MTRTRMLNDQEGKTLRFVTSRDVPTRPIDCVVRIQWSDLPHTVLEARAVLNRLEEWGYVKRVGKGFQSTTLGVQLVKKADKRGMWKQAPPPEVTNINYRQEVSQ